MDARPLRDLLADLVGDAEARQAYGADPSGYLAAHGHPDLPSGLVSEAVVAYADTAPVEVASVLAPYVAAHGPVPDPDARGDWFELLTSADPVGADAFGEHLETAAPTGDWSDPAELDFGAGSVVDEVAEPVDAVPDDAVPDEAVAVGSPAPEWSPDVVDTPEPPIEGLAVEDDDAEDEFE